VKTLARALDLDFRRIQFTPDLMPADIIGTTVMSAGPDGRYQFEFRRGPIFTQLLLADEINRATPKTQSALLETMQEGASPPAVRRTCLRPPFLRLATQNPLEQEGTYPLPEAQLDRFMFKAERPLPQPRRLNEMVRRTTLGGQSDVPRIMSGDRIMELRTVLEKVVVADPLRDYAVRLVLATHPEASESGDSVKKFVKWGAIAGAPCRRSIRAARVRRACKRAARTSAFRGHPPILHPKSSRTRVLLNYDALAENLSVPAWWMKSQARAGGSSVELETTGKPANIRTMTHSRNPVGPARSSIGKTPDPPGSD